MGHTKTMVSAIVSISDGLSKIKPIDPDHMTAFLDAARQVVHMLENLPLDKEIRAMDLKVQASAFQMITGDLQKMVAPYLLSPRRWVRWKTSTPITYSAW